MHQYGKKICRSSKNFVNLASTINSRNQKHRALYLETSNYKSINLFARPNSSPRLLTELPEDCLPVPSATRPFPIEKSILRKLETRRDMYFLTIDFCKSSTSDVIYCHGKVLRKKTKRNPNNQLTFVKLHDHLYELEVTPGFEDRYIQFSELHFSNDFYFEVSEEEDEEIVYSKMYLLEWLL